MNDVRTESPGRESIEAVASRDVVAMQESVPGPEATLLYSGVSEDIRAEVARISAHMRLVVWAASGLGDTLSRLDEGHHPICVLELGGAGESTRIVQAIRSQYPWTVIIGISDPNHPESTSDALRAGLFDVLGRPIRATELAVLISNAREHLAFVASQRDAPAPEAASYGVFGMSHVMRDVMRVVQRAAPSRCGVIIWGERGTGREMVARAIHAHGHRPQAPFVKVDCALTAPQDLEQELFGLKPVRRGESERVRHHLEYVMPTSQFYQAVGGTLFLENIAAMPDRVQARLVRLLRDREAVIPDRREPIDADVRPIAAIEPALTRAIDEGRLREDLYEQLSVIRIDLPALRHRREDIPLIANHFLKEICRANGSPTKTLSRAATALLAALSWRGNARELRALLERLVLLVPHAMIRIEDVLAHVRLDSSLAAVGAAATLREARLHFEREYIKSVLQQHHGRMGEAAKALGIQRTNLYRKVRSLNLSARRPERRG